MIKRLFPAAITLHRDATAAGGVRRVRLIDASAEVDETLAAGKAGAGRAA